MENIIRKLANQTGGMSIRKSGTQDPFTMWELNLSVVLPPLVQEAVILTQRFIVEKDKDNLEEANANIETLDFVAKFYFAYTSLALQDRKQAMSGFAELFAYLDTDKKKSIYSYFTSSFMQSVFCYIYTSSSLGVGINRGISSDTWELTDEYCLMSRLSDETRAKVYAELMAQGSLPATPGIERLLRRTLDFRGIIEEEQNKQKAKAAAKVNS
jgi:hypothetical protein